MVRDGAAPVIGRAFARTVGAGPLARPLTMRNGLQHRQASRPPTAREGRVEGRDFRIAKHEVARRGVFGGVLGR